MKSSNVPKALSILHKTYPNVHYYLCVKTPLETLVGALLSAQVRDEVVNEALPELFKRYKTAEDYAKADLNELTHIIRKITFASTKAKNIKKACTILVEKYNGRVPKTQAGLTSLPGIGEKTARAILQNAFNIIEGIVVDTHVLRVAYRLGWTSSEKNAEKSGHELIEIIPKKEWKKLPWLLKAHGRAICKAPNPFCSKCPLNKLCPKQGVKKKL
jgi:endonuclease-3